MEKGKKKRSLILYLVLILAISLGYALLSSTLNINGTAGINKNTWNIHWDSDSILVTSGSVNSNVPVVSGDKDETVEFTVDLELPGDFYEFSIDAVNEGTIDGIISGITSKVYEEDGETETTIPDYITYTVTYEDGTTVPLEGNILKVGESKKYKVRVEYDSDAEEVPSMDLVYKYRFNVKYEQYAGDDEIEPTVEPICKRATTLHTETCSNGSCINAGYKSGDTITYGRISTGTFEYGNAYDCKVKSDGNYTERFYYVGNNGDKAALIYYANFEGAEVGLSGSYAYDVALTKLPSSEIWDNIETTFGDKAARFITPSEVENACSITIPTSTSNSAVLDHCQFIMENSRFSSTTTGRSGIWLEHTTDLGYRRIHTQNRFVASVANTSANVARPVIEVDISKINNSIDPSELATITFDVQGGNPIGAISVMKGTAIGELPIPIKEFHVFDGWYTDITYTTEVTSSTVVTGNIEIVAKWSELDGVAVVNGRPYSTLTEAITAVPNNTKTTISLIKDIPNESISVGSSKNIVLNLNEHTLSITNTDSTNVVKNSGTLEIKNGTITSPGGSGAIDNNGGTLLINGVTISMTGTRQAVYNKGGSLTIDGGSILSTTSNSQRAVVQNLNDGSKIGTTKILNATITSPNNAAVIIDSGVVTLGEEDGVAADKPLLIGETYGINATSTFNFYDGIIKGKDKSINNDTKMVDKEENATVLKEQDGDYEKATLVLETSKYKITFNPNGGEVTTSYKLINAGDPVGELPVPTKGIYTFDGWYTDMSVGVKVEETDIPTGSVTYYAHWSYNASNEIVNFNMNSDPMNVYYNSIATWKDDQSTFQTSMDTNFNNYTCSACTGPRYQECPSPAAGTNLCDQSKGYNTGVSDDLKVYESNESKEIGDLVEYTTSTNGVIYNMIPGQIYYWKSAVDASIHGYVKANGNRRTINTTVRNVRDLGGMEVDVDNDGVVDGTLRYGKIFRGAKLSSNTIDASNLEKLGITEEIDLRASSDGAGEAVISKYENREITNYLIDKETHATNYAVFRQAVKDTMQDIVDGENIYFHCKIGTDRTGTLAYFLEGLLGVSEEDRVQDYELSYFYGLLNRHRFHDQLDGSSINPRFTSMHNKYNTNQKIYDWFMDGSTESERQNDINLIDRFRETMIKSY